MSVARNLAGASSSSHTTTQTVSKGHEQLSSLFEEVGSGKRPLRSWQLQCRVGSDMQRHHECPCLWTWTAHLQTLGVKIFVAVHEETTLGERRKHHSCAFERMTMRLDRIRSECSLRTTAGTSPEFIVTAQVTSTLPPLERPRCRQVLVPSPSIGISRPRRFCPSSWPSTLSVPRVTRLDLRDARSSSQSRERGELLTRAS